MRMQTQMQIATEEESNTNTHATDTFSIINKKPNQSTPDLFDPSPDRVASGQWLAANGSRRIDMVRRSIYPSAHTHR